jgi:hypothetical protein
MIRGDLPVQPTASCFPFARSSKILEACSRYRSWGTTLVIWFKEIIAFAIDFIGLILLTSLGGLICLFDHFVFKSRMPRREDMKKYQR